MAALKAPRAFTDPRAQSASLIAVGAFAVHQLRYLLASGGLGGDDLLERGHSYLMHSVPLIAGILVASLTARVVRRTIFDGGALRSRRVRAASYAIGIVAVFCCQELAEEALLSGHAGGVAAIFSTGGWAAIPLAALFGLIAALVDRGIEVVENARHSESPEPSTAPPPPAPSAPLLTFDLLAPLAFGLARRPPPSLT